MKHFYEFGPFCLDADERLLVREGRHIALPPKVYETLFVLVGSNGRVLTKDELMRAIWPDAFVEEANLAHNISELRKALGDSPERPQYIQTIPRRGYRFIAEVRRPEEGHEGVIGPPIAPRPISEVDSQQEADNAGHDTLVFRRRELHVPALLITASLVGVIVAPTCGRVAPTTPRVSLVSPSCLSSRSPRLIVMNLLNWVWPTP